MRILLLEEDLVLGGRLCARLQQDAYQVDWVQSRHAADLAITANSYALVILDLGLRREEGFAVLARLRQRAERVPVLAIAAREAAPDPVLSLDLGADDCLVWPFSLEELAARARAVLRRYSIGRQRPAMAAPRTVR